MKSLHKKKRMQYYRKNKASGKHLLTKFHVCIGPSPLSFFFFFLFWRALSTKYSSCSGDILFPTILRVKERLDYLVRDLAIEEVKF